MSKSSGIASREQLRYTLPRSPVRWYHSSGIGGISHRQAEATYVAAGGEMSDESFGELVDISHARGVGPMQLSINVYLLYGVLYTVSVVGGYYAVKLLLFVIRKTTRQDQKAHPFDFWLGGTERAVVTTLVILAPSYVAAFIGAWIALKIAANWQRRTNTDATRKGTQTALIGNVLSFAIAIGCGVLANRDALRIWYAGAE